VAVGDDDAAGLARRLPQGSIGAALDPVGVVLIPDPDAPGRPAQVATALSGRPAVLGPTVPWQEAHRSIIRATSAWPLHAAGLLGDDHLARTEEHLLTLILAADPALMRDLAARRLRPLHEMPAGVRARAESTLHAWLDAHGDVSVAAEILHVHPQTVRYRLAALRDAFGEALDVPVARLELALALRAPSPPEQDAVRPRAAPGSAP
jgi:hypothetical protein